MIEKIKENVKEKSLNYRESKVVKEFYKFVAENNLREEAYRLLNAIINEKDKTVNHEDDLIEDF